MPKTKHRLKPTKFYRRNYAALFVILFAVVGGYILLRSFAASPPSSTDTQSDLVPGQLLLSFKTDTPASAQDEIIRNYHLSVVKEIPQIKVKVVKVPVTAADAVKIALSHNPTVSFVEQDRKLKPQEKLPDDPSFPQTFAIGGGAWGWYATHTTQAWDITQGSPSINIAILDTGIKTSGLADFNGQISSTWNVMNNTSDATTNAGNHGTYVAGVAGLTVNNAIGNAGYCPLCKLMIVQVGTDSGANLSDIASGETYAADHGAKVINMSWAGSADSTTLQNATNYAHSKGLVIFASAGNSNCDCKTYPAGEQNVLGVGGVSDAAGDKQGDSNFGTWVKVAAPEGNMSAWPTINGAPGYAPVGGTSVASPAAAAIAGLLFSYNASLSNTQVEQALENSAAPVKFTLAYGLVDALAALQSLGAADPQPSSLPVNSGSAPQIYVETNGDWNYTPLGSTVPQVGQILLRGQGEWTGSSPLSLYQVKWYRCDTTGVSCTIVNQTETYTIQSTDTGYTFKLSVTVKNNLGTVAYTTPISAPVGGSADTTPPSTPGNFQSTSNTQNSINLSWSASSDNVGVSGYRITRNGATIITTSGATLAYNDTGLTSGTSYTYTIVALDASGNVSAAATLTANTSTSTGVGDCNGDGHVNVTDMSILLSNFNTNYSACDFNHDNIVNILDLSALLTNYGA